MLTANLPLVTNCDCRTPQLLLATLDGLLYRQHVFVFEVGQLALVLKTSYVNMLMLHACSVLTTC